MSNSCSSENDGCATCAPGLYLFSLGSTVGQSKVGHSCLDNSINNKVYANRINSSSSSYSYSMSTQFACPTPTPEFTSSFAFGSSYSISSSNYIYDINSETGAIEISTNNTENSDSQCQGKFVCDGCDVPGGHEEYPIGCGNSISCNANSNLCNVSEIDQTILECEKYEHIYTYNAVINNSSQCCEGLPGCCPPGPDCPNATSVYVNGTTSQNSKSNSSISSEKDLAFFHSLCKRSVEKIIDINDKNDNYGFASYFTIVDNHLEDNPESSSTNYQKIKFKIATPKDGFNKKYKSVSGTVVFYYGGTYENTSCCKGENFDGVIIKETHYSLSDGETFKGNYIAADAGEFNNDDQNLVGQTIKMCVTVDQVSFI